MKLFFWLATVLLVGKGDAFEVSPLMVAVSSSCSGRASRDARATKSSSSRVSMAAHDDLRAAAASCSLAVVLLLGSPLLPTLSQPEPAAAISGGGLDYSGLNLTGQDFSKGKYKSKDFSGAIAKEVSFKGSDLRGARFFKADLKEADFTGANLGTASLEEADLDGAVLTNAVATGSYFGNNLGNVGDISGADFTDALIRKDNAKALCARPDAKGTNPTTGTDTRDSLLCDMF